MWPENSASGQSVAATNASLTPTIAFKAVKPLSGALFLENAIDGLPPKPVSTLAQIMARIERCESGGDPLARNSTSSAKGLYQIIDGTWDAFSCTGNVLNGEDNRRCAWKIATTSGIHHWNASRACWGR
jgi:hypothetical protein